LVELRGARELRDAERADAQELGDVALQLSERKPLQVGAARQPQRRGRDAREAGLDVVPGGSFPEDPPRERQRVHPARRLAPPPPPLGGWKPSKSASAGSPASRETKRSLRPSCSVSPAWSFASVTRPCATRSCPWSRGPSRFSRARSASDRSSCPSSM